MIRLRHKGQTSLEYIILIIIVMGAFLVMGNYVKRGVQGRWKATIDDVGDQYDPKSANASIMHTITSDVATEIATVDDASGGYWTFRSDTANSVERRVGSIQVGDY